MYQKTVSLENADLLLIEWAKNLSNLTIKKEGIVIGSMQSKDELKQGRRFALPNGQFITVVYSEHGLEVWQNGKELMSGAKSGDTNGAAAAFGGMVLIGAVQVIFAVIAYFAMKEHNLLGAALFGSPGLVLLGMALWSKLSTNKTPYIIAIVVCVLDLVFLWHNLFGIILLGGLIYYLTLAIKAEVPQPAKLVFSDPDAPLDSNL